MPTLHVANMAAVQAIEVKFSVVFKIFCDDRSSKIV
jgi:hypothetical protein